MLTEKEIIIYNLSEKGAIAQVVERGPEKPGVPRSTRGRATLIYRRLR